MLLSDTVGFIRDLPHHLIESFKATLEEARQADLLLHVADAANPAVYEQIAAAYKVLEEIGIRQKDTLLVINKIDALPDRARLDGLLSRYPDAVPISARSGLGLAAPGRGGERRLEPQFSRRGRGDGRRERPPAGLPGRPRRGPLETVSDERVIVHCRISAHFLGQIEATASVGVRARAKAGVGRRSGPRVRPGEVP